jgi:hypothetical protein
MESKFETGSRYLIRDPGSKRLTVDMGECHRWLESAKPGDKTVYWTGMLIEDRDGTRFKSPDNRAGAAALDSLAKFWWEMHEQDAVCLFQYRVGFKEYYYMAKRVTKGVKS